MRTLSAATAAEVVKPATRPIWLVELGFTTVVRYSSRETLTYLGVGWSAASLSIRAGNTVDLFNEAFALGSVLLSEGTAGKTIKIYQLYGDGPTWADADGILIFDGEMASAEVNERVVIRPKERAPRSAPNLYAAAPTFNHLPRAGLEIVTNTSVVTLRAANG